MRSDAGLIPQDWRVSTIGAEFRVQLGKMVDAAKNSGVPKPYLGNRSVQWGRIDVDDIDTVPMTRADLQRFRLRQGDLLVCEGGEIGRAAIWDDPIPECYYQKALHRLRSKGGYDAYLMMSLLERWASTGCLANYVTQTSIAHLPKDQLEIVPLPSPAPRERRAITEVLSDVDLLQGALEDLIAKKRAMKQASTRKFLTGQIHLPGFRGDWERKMLGNISTMLPTASNPRSDLSDWGEIGYIHYGDVHSHPHPVLNCARHDLPRIGKDRVGSAVHIQNGDLVMVDASEDLVGVGKSIQVQGVAERAVVAGLHTILCRGKRDDWAPGFMAYLQFIPEFRSSLLRVTSGTSVYAISRRQLADVELPLPPPSEQEAIVAILSDMDAEIAALELRRQKTRTIKQGMMQQLLTGRIRLVESEAMAKGAAAS